MQLCNHQKVGNKMRKLGRDILAACQVNDVGCAPHIIHILLKNRFETERCDVALNGTNKVLTHYRKSAGSKHDLFAVKGNEQGGVIEGIPIGIKGRWGTQFKALQYMKGNGEHMKLQCVRQAFNRTLKRAKEYQKYCLFAQELIQIAGNAVKLETSFKTVRIVHNQWRRSLRKDRLAKLVKCHYNIPNIEKVKGMPIV
eukprot:20993_1